MFEINYLKLGQKGVINYDLPVYSIGSSKPEITIACSIHGDETAGLFIVSNFLKKIADKKILGKINIIPSANPVAQFLYSRTAFLDQKDLNRTGNGRDNGSYTDRLANTLMNFYLNSDIVINIHEFEMISPVMAIFDRVNEIEIENKIMEAIKVFNPDMIWQINYDKSSDIQYQTTLDMALTKKGIVNFAFETSQLALISKEDIEKASQGLFNLVSYYGMIENTLEQNNKIITAYIRKETTSELSGLWEPNESLKVLTKIKKGQIIGKIISLPDFMETEIYSQEDGILLQYRHRQIIGTGSAIYSLG